MLRERWRSLPKLIRFMTMRFSDGVALGWTCGLLLIWFDVYRIGTLLQNNESALPTALFFLQTGMLFGTLVMCISVVSLGEGG